MMGNNLKVGQRVCFTATSGNSDRTVRLITALEEHQGLTFYRVSGQPRGIFIRSSLAKTRREFIPREGVW